LNEGDKRYINSGSAETTLQGATATITTDCDDPVLMTKWFDYLFTEEGSLLGSYGIEGQAHTIVDGKPVFTDLIMNNPDNLTPGDAKNAYAFPMLMPFLVMTEREVDTFSEGAVKATELWDSDWDIANSRTLQGDLTADESFEFTSKYLDIETFVSEFKAHVIAGQKQITDETWNEYLNEIKGMGIDRCIELKQEALDRYNNR
jgi:putative aldouronate transport system substrate-binding protein